MISHYEEFTRVNILSTHVWVQTARLYLHLICIISNKYQNSGIFSKTKRKPEKVAKHTSAHLKDVLPSI